MQVLYDPCAGFGAHFGEGFQEPCALGGSRPGVRSVGPSRASMAEPGPAEARRPRRPSVQLSPIATKQSPLADETFSLSETGTFSKGGFSIKATGITASPLGKREVSNLAYAELEPLHVLGTGASSVVRVARHRPTGKLVALKVRKMRPAALRALPAAHAAVLQLLRVRLPAPRGGSVVRWHARHSEFNGCCSVCVAVVFALCQVLNMMGDAATREQAINELRVLHDCNSPHLISLFDAFYANGSLLLALQVRHRSAACCVRQLRGGHAAPLAEGPARSQGRPATET